VLKRKQKCVDEGVKRYYKKLHAAKKTRQEKWINELMKSVADSFKTAIENTGAGNDNNSIIVAALPEFFWVDINDNRKHEQPEEDNKKPEEDITNYHKPLYSSVVSSTLKNKANPIAQLTDKYKNLIFFAGTAMNKEINEESRVEEKIKNTLFIYYDGALKKTWGKNHFSGIDGFHRRDVFANQDYLIKDKMGQADNQDAVPEIDFKGKKFAFDICLDFCAEVFSKNPMVYQPLSAKRLNGSPVDVNILIAGGMPIYDNNNQLMDYAARASSNYILRCDATPDDAGYYCEIGDKVGDNRTRNLIDLSTQYTGNFHIVQNNVKI
jgi:hypothetical protein